jgi:hypothetical protein
MSAKFVAPKVQVVDSNCGGGPGACSIAKQKADIADAMEYRNMQGGNTAVERVGLVDNASTQHANANIKKIMEAGEQLEADAKYDGDVNVVKGGGLLKLLGLKKSKKSPKKKAAKKTKKAAKKATKKAAKKTKKVAKKAKKAPKKAAKKKTKKAAKKGKK